MTQPLAEALSDAALDVDARPTLVADARRGARRRQRRRRTGGLSAGVAALAGAASLVIATSEGPAVDRIVAPTAPGVYEVPFRGGLTVNGTYRLEPPGRGFVPTLSLTEAAAVRAPRDLLPLDGHVVEGMLAVLAPMVEPAQVSVPTPVWHLVVQNAYPIDVRRAGVRTGGIVCDYTIDLDARTGRNLAGPASACTQDELTTLEQLSASGGQIVYGSP